MNQKHIVIVIDSLAGGGAEKVMLTLLQTLQNLGHLCTLILLKQTRDYAIPSGVDARFFDAKKNWFLSTQIKTFAAMLQAAEQEKGAAALVLSNLEKSNRLVAQLNHPNRYFIIHNAINESLKARRRHPVAWLKMRQAFKVLSGKNLIAVSQGVQRGIAASKLIQPASVNVIYNPVDVAKIIELASEPTTRLPSGPYLIHVGRVARQKRYDVLFEALSKTQTNIPLVCLCRNIKKAKKIAQRFGVLDRVIFPAFQQNPYPWIKNAKALVLSSDFEGLGMVLIEALICETIVISTDCNYGPREILTGPLSRNLVPVGDSQQLAARMDEVANNLVPFVKSPIVEDVNANNIAKQYLALIEKPQVTTKQIQ